MPTVTIPQKEYERLKRYSSAYVKIAEEMADAERVYPYDYAYISGLMRTALRDHKKGKSISADSIDEALAKFKKK